MNFRKVTLLAFSLLVSTSGWAFKIKPDTTPDTLFRSQYATVEDHFTHPIHERMAFLSYVCAVEKADGEKCDGIDTVDQQRMADVQPLIHGARWNDDPNNSFRTDSGFTWVVWMFAAGEEAKHGGVKSIDPLQYRSHYGDLQFLHAMAQGGDANHTTRDHILDWSHFAYDVATGELATNVPLVKAAKTYPFAQAFASSKLKAEWTVKTLFLNALDYKGKGKTISGFSDADVPMIALGALLHTVQDSYSASHTQRERKETGSSSEIGRVVSFLDYTQQNPRCHSHEDMQDGWLASGSTDLDNPVDHGAWIMRRALDRGGHHWSEVNAYLLRLFEPVNPDGLSGSGGFDQCSG